MKRYQAILVVLLLMAFSGAGFAEEKKTLAEIWLAPEYQNEPEKIKDWLKLSHITRSTIQLYKVGVPAAIVAVGESTPAEGGRAAIELARKYNRKKVEYLIPEILLPVNYIAVGTSAYDESVLIPVESADVDRLADPSLSTEAFHLLYQKLTHADVIRRSGQPKGRFFYPERL
ncbi:MAG: hypothetical protein HYR81_01215 [Nitrospirae bacterium]|nr:hypothetical protein [Nitrospirota bacterium]